MNRRQFLILGWAGLAGAGIASCAKATATPVTIQPTATSHTGLPGATPTPVLRPAETSSAAWLSSADEPGFYVRFIREFAALEPGRWRLEIKGLLGAPTTMTLDQIMKNLPFQKQNTRLKCVEGWSSRAVWGGFTYASLAALVQPRPEVTHLSFRCEDGYFEVLPVEDLLKKGALFVTHMNGDPIGAKHGAPLRMIIPWLYGYKGPKTINSIEFSSTGDNGYWSTFGGYSSFGSILPGLDVPIDLGWQARTVSGGEVIDY